MKDLAKVVDKAFYKDNSFFFLFFFWGGGRGVDWLRTWKLKKKWNFQRGVQEKTMWNFHESWFLSLEFARGVTQFCRISRNESLFSLKFLRVRKGKVQKSKNTQPPCLVFFWLENPQPLLLEHLLNQLNGSFQMF